MTCFDWVLIGLWSAEAVFVVTTVGEHREPRTPRGAAAVVAIAGLLIAGLLVTRL